MLTSLRHRGPDDCGIETHDDVVLGHVRLAIIDIKGGKQPMRSFDNRYTLILNGEIYNYLELRHLLTNKGYTFKTHSDSEVLMYMYYEYKEKALEYINGMFAFAIYDSMEKTLFLARDHFGIKPLYYFQDKDIFIFASEIKALLKHPRVKAQVDLSSLHEYVTLQMVLGEDTLFNLLCRFRQETINEAKKMLQGSDVMIIRKLVKLFGHIGNNEDISFIKLLLEHEDMNVRMDALEALLKLKDPWSNKYSLRWFFRLIR